MFKLRTLELCKDIAAAASLLMKFECDDILTNQTLFIEFLNESGFRTVKGQEFSKMSFRNMFERLPHEDRRSVIAEFMEGHRDTEVLCTMFS